MKYNKDAVLARPIDNLGRVVIPKEIRKSLELYAGKCLSIYTYGTSIILSPTTEGAKTAFQEPMKTLPDPLLKEISNAVAQLDSQDVLAWIDMLRRMARMAK